MSKRMTPVQPDCIFGLSIRAGYDKRIPAIFIGLLEADIFTSDRFAIQAAEPAALRG
jgi:hypothetical protein